MLAGRSGEREQANFYAQFVPVDEVCLSVKPVPKLRFMSSPP